MIELGIDFRIDPTQKNKWKISISKLVMRGQKKLFDIHDYHMDIMDVATVAKEANVEPLALNHLPLKTRSKCYANWLFRNPIEYSGALFVGEDGMKIMIPL